MDAYVGEIRLFSFNFPPKNWLPCDGQLVEVRQFQSLYSILGTTYGGDGVTNFKLPDLRGRTPVHSGNGEKGGPKLGQTGGQDRIALTSQTIPGHGHQFLCATSEATATSPTGNILAVPATSPMYSSDASKATPLASGAVGGAGVPYDNRQPYQVLQYCICANGLFPPKD